jgi:hypothetical protein
MKLLSFKPIAKNSLRGVADVELEIGLQIIGVMLHVKHGKPWISLPSKPCLDAEGQHILADNGKKQYAPVLSWRDTRHRDVFGKAVIDLILERHLEALS